MQHSDITVSNVDNTPIQMGQDVAAESKITAVDKDDFYRQLELAHKGLQESLKVEDEGETLVSKHQEENPVMEEQEEDLVHAEPDEEEEQEEPVVQRNNAKGRINKEIEKRKALEEQLNAEREARIRIETERDLYTSAMKKLSAPKEAPVEEIDPLDSDAHALYMREISNIRKEIELYKQKEQQRDEQNHISNALNRQQEEYLKQTPDFNDAYQFIVKREQENLMMLGADEANALEMTRQKLAGAAQNALANGRNVPDMLYNLAKGMGYASGTPAPTTRSGTNLSALDRNKRASADLTRDIPAVATTMRANSFDAASMNMDDINAKVWEDGRFNPDAFNKMVAIAHKKKP